jgi:TolB-like protein
MWINTRFICPLSIIFKEELLKFSIEKGLVLIILIALCLFSGCVSSSKDNRYIKNNKAYGVTEGAFRHRWWNYYERGLSFAEGQFYQEAVADLKQAAKHRAKDQRMARTYGMHFVDYFPHRELGIIYYLTGNLNEAGRELALSLNHFPSAKARFYLDKVRKALIEQEAKEVLPPRLTLNFKMDEVWTREDPVVVSGVAEDEQYIADLFIMGVPLFLEGSQKKVPFEKSLILSQGRHAIEVEAINLLGKVTKDRVIIHVDREGPMITLDEILFDEALSGREVTVQGSIYDKAGVSELRINGRSIPVQESKEFFFSEKFIADKNDFELVTKDRLGNQTSTIIPIFNSQSTASAPVLLASADSDFTSYLVAGLFDPEDISPPTINLKGWTDTQTVFLEKIYLEGQISDDTNIVSLAVNGVSMLRRQGRNIFFSHLVDLKEGENNILIDAVDKAGNRATRNITVIRKIPRALQLSERLSLTVFPFEKKGAVAQTGLSFQDNLIANLIDQNRFRIVERDKLDIILSEQKLSRTKLIDKSTALKLGRLMAAQSIIAGKIIETSTGIEIVARLIDTETSEILAAEDVYDEVKDPAALRSLAEGMAVKFHREFPLLDGLVVQKKGEHIFTDLGQGRIKNQRRLIVYREEPVKHPVTGKIIGADNQIIGRARVTQVMPEMSKAVLLDAGDDIVKPLDKVITE